LWDFANKLVPAKNCGEFNQSMMEIGSQLCTPKNPQCHACPLLTSCPTGQLGHTDQIPVPKPPKTITDLTEAVVLVKNTSAQYLVRRCDHGERWAGLWDFPRFDVTGCKGTVELTRKLKQSLSDRFCLRVNIADTQRSLRHTVTRYRIHLLCFSADVREEQIQELSSPPHPDKIRWLHVDALQELAWNASAKRILKWVQESHRPGNLGPEDLGLERC
jgi:A/G-specific adenine glycosylase